MNNLPLEIQKFLSSNSIATIATLSDKNDYPYVLPMFYVVDNDFNLYFASHKMSKKVENILFHPHIGISITDSDNLISLQLQGTASIAEQKSEIIQKILKVANQNSENSMPPIMQIETGLMEVVTFTIHWFRLADYSGKDALQTEGTLS